MNVSTFNMKEIEQELSGTSADLQKYVSCLRDCLEEEKRLRVLAVKKLKENE